MLTALYAKLKFTLPTEDLVNNRCWARHSQFELLLCWTRLRRDRPLGKWADTPRRMRTLIVALLLGHHYAHCEFRDLDRCSEEVAAYIYSQETMSRYCNLEKISLRILVGPSLITKVDFVCTR